MSTITEKLQLLLDTKLAIKAAIIDRGKTVSDSDTFSSYADKILSINKGGVGCVTVSGRVDNVPTPVTIIFTNTTTSEIFPCSVDSNGMYAVSVPEGSYSISLSNIDYAVSPNSISLTALTQNLAGAISYIQFEDSEVGRLCAINWGDYNEVVETVTEDSEDVTVATTFVSMNNTTATRGQTVTTTRAKTAEDTVGTKTTKVAVGITRSQAAAVTSIGTVFTSKTNISYFDEFKYFTGVTSIVENSAARLQNSSLLYITLPESITSLGAYAFSRMDNTVRIDLPASVRYLNKSAFTSIKNPTTVIFRNTTPPTFSATPDAYFGRLNPIYVPDDSVDAYKAATGWSSYASHIYPLSEYTGR